MRRDCREGESHQLGGIDRAGRNDSPSSSHSGLISMTWRAYSREVSTSSNQRMSFGGGWCWNIDEEG